MKEYEVCAVFGASRSGTIMANSIEEAEEKAYDELGYASLCHHCSREIDIGDCNGTLIYEDGEEVFDSTHSGEMEKTVSLQQEKIAKLQKERDELAAQVEHLLKSIVELTGLELADDVDDWACKTQAQCLADIKADAVEEARKALAQYVENHDAAECTFLQRYANKLREGKE